MVPRPLREQTKTLPVTVSRWAYFSLPRTEGGNRFDRTWLNLDWTLRVYVGEMTRHHASWHLNLGRGEFWLTVRLTGERVGRGIYSGPEPSTRALCDDEENWTFPRHNFWRGRDRYGWWRFGFGHMRFTLRSPRMWSVGYDSRHVNAYMRLRRKKAEEGRGS